MIATFSRRVYLRVGVLLFSALSLLCLLNAMMQRHQSTTNLAGSAINQTSHGPAAAPPRDEELGAPQLEELRQLRAELGLVPSDHLAQPPGPPPPRQLAVRAEQQWAEVRNRKGKLLGIQAAAENTGARTSHRGEARIPEYPVVDPLHATGPNRIMAIADSPSVEGCPSLQVAWDDACSLHVDGRLHPRGLSAPAAQGEPQSGPSGDERAGAGPYVSLLPPVTHHNQRKRNVHAPSLLLLPEGDVLCAWFAGVEGTNGVLIAVSLLRRDQWSWAEPRVVAHQRRRSLQNPVLFHDNGTVVLLHTSQPSWRGQPAAHVEVARSRTWGSSFSSSKPVIQRMGAFVRHPPVLSADGREWLLPMYYTPGQKALPGRPTSIGTPKMHHCAMRRSANTGATWLANHEVLMSRPGQLLVQPSVVRLPPRALNTSALADAFANRTVGEPLLAVFRSRKQDRIYLAYSLDDGRSWTKPLPSSLPNSDSAVQALVLSSGTLMVVFNNAQGNRNRWPLSVALSEDGGQSWPWIRDLETKDSSIQTRSRLPREYSYPAAVQAADGSIHVAYTFKKTRIKHVVLSERWLRHPPCASQAPLLPAQCAIPPGALRAVHAPSPADAPAPPALEQDSEIVGWIFPDEHGGLTRVEALSPGHAGEEEGREGEGEGGADAESDNDGGSAEAFARTGAPAPVQPENSMEEREAEAANEVDLDPERTPDQPASAEGHQEGQEEKEHRSTEGDREPHR